MDKFEVGWKDLCLSSQTQDLSYKQYYRIFKPGKRQKFVHYHLIKRI